MAKYLKEYNKIEDDEIEIDLIALAKALWHRLWAIILAAVVIGGATFSYARFYITPMYRAEALMYVNNSSFSVGSTSFSISSSELTAAQSLVDTYIVILNTRTTLNAVIKDAKLDYTYEELKDMISAEALNNTEIFRVAVESADPEEAEVIANSIAKILPDKIADIVDGSSVRIVDHAIVPSEKVSPNITKMTAIGCFVGAFIAATIIVVLTLLDTKIHDEEYLLQTYNLPVLAVVPNLYRVNESSSYYGTYGSSKKEKDEVK